MKHTWQDNPLLKVKYQISQILQIAINYMLFNATSFLFLITNFKSGCIIILYYT